MLKIIGIAGLAGAGKDTVADYLIRQMPEYRKIAFADPIKNMLKTGLKMTDNQLQGCEKNMVDRRYGKSPRQIMQTLGTEWGRGYVNKDLWIYLLEKERGTYPAIISDVRFQNEAEYVRKNGVLIHVVGRGDSSHKHSSESGVDIHRDDIVIENDSSVKNLYRALFHLLIKS